MTQIPPQDILYRRPGIFAGDGAGECASPLSKRLAPMTPEPPMSKIDSVLDRSRLAFAAGQTASALAAVRQAVEHAPERGEPLFLLCSLLLRKGDPEATRIFSQCLSRFASPSPGWVEVGEALLDKGHRAAALVCFARGGPDGALALRCGQLERDLGRLAEALSWFKTAVDLDPSSARARFLLGVCAQDLGDHALAAQAYRAVLALNPENAEAEVNLGIVLQAMGDLVGAKQAYGRAVRKRPDSFGRVAQALPGSPKGELWLDLVALRRSLVG
jgi:Flp pilus assembly protein TadD